MSGTRPVKIEIHLDGTDKDEVEEQLTFTFGWTPSPVQVVPGFIEKSLVSYQQRHCSDHCNQLRDCKEVRRHTAEGPVR